MMALRTAAREARLLATLRAATASCRAFSTAPAEAPVAAQAAAEADPGLPSASESSVAVLHVNASVTANAAKAGRAAKADARRKQPRRRTPPAAAQQPVAQQPGSFAAQSTQGPLSGAALLAAIGEGTSIRQLTGLLLANRAEVASEHMMRAISRMGRLQRLAAATPPSESDQEAFAGTLEVALDMMASEGRSLSPLACCRVMEAAAWLELPPSPQQQAVLEAALAAALHRVQWGRGDAHNWELLLTSYVRLGLQPGPALAAMFAPPLCKASWVKL
ncbi:hypothetical protein D9Q98_007373 [Chlorella vulgaris]|uniref:Uncharacterized protein n=1 Tax=Chlorella vulgaris TaxID=3077 RepID=A0A9D4TL42_CHLVU|nr:hypothetical protein D9Q98_007373 [Chlorella vulgaris]